MTTPRPDETGTGQNSSYRDTRSRSLQRMVRRFTAWAWRDEIAASESIAMLKELHATEGAMELHIKQRPEVSQWVAQCFASMVVASPNYTEMKFDIPVPGKWEWLTVLIKKGNGKTPHQLRTEAEQETARLKDLLDARSHGTGAEAPNDLAQATPPGEVVTETENV